MAKINLKNAMFLVKIRETLALRGSAVCPQVAARLHAALRQAGQPLREGLRLGRRLVHPSGDQTSGRALRDPEQYVLLAPSA